MPDANAAVGDAQEFVNRPRLQHARQLRRPARRPTSRARKLPLPPRSSRRARDLGCTNRRCAASMPTNPASLGRHRDNTLLARLTASQAATLHATKHFPATWQDRRGEGHRQVPPARVRGRRAPIETALCGIARQHRGPGRTRPQLEPRRTHSWTSTPPRSRPLVTPCG